MILVEIISGIWDLGKDISNINRKSGGEFYMSINFKKSLKVKNRQKKEKKHKTTAWGKILLAQKKKLIPESDIQDVVTKVI